VGTASPGSLRDLALLGARVTDPDHPWLPEPSNGLERLEHAHALDCLHTAHAAWVTASTELGHAIRGTTTAPGHYGGAIKRLLTIDLNADLSAPSVRLAIATALPRLGGEAGNSIHHLVRTNALVTPRREPGKLSAWRPIDHHDAAELARRFADASKASSAAVTTLAGLLPGPERRVAHRPPGAHGSNAGPNPPPPIAV